MRPSLTSGFPSSFIKVGMDGPKRSASSKPTFSLHVLASATAKLTARTRKVHLMNTKNLIKLIPLTQMTYQFHADTDS